MQKRRRSWIKGAGLVALLCLAPPALADDHAKGRAYIQGAYRKMDEAVSRRDAAGVTAFMRPDYVSINKAGDEERRNTRAGQRAALAHLFAGATRVKAHSTVAHIRFSRQGATVDTSSTHSVTMAVKGHNITVNVGETDRDLWVGSGGVWRLKTNLVLSDSEY